MSGKEKISVAFIGIVTFVAGPGGGRFPPPGQAAPLYASRERSVSRSLGYSGMAREKLALMLCTSGMSHTPPEDSKRNACDRG